MQGANLGHGSRDAHLCSFGLPLSSTQAVRDVRCLMFPGMIYFLVLIDYWSTEYTVGRGQGWTAAVHDDAVYLHGGSDLNFFRKQQPNSRNHPQYTRSSEATLLFHGLVSGEATMSPHSETTSRPTVGNSPGTALQGGTCCGHVWHGFCVVPRCHMTNCQVFNGEDWKTNTLMTAMLYPGTGAQQQKLQQL